MEFQTISFESIKSISQRSLLRLWAGLAGSRPFPSFSEFRSDSRIHDPKQLVVWKIEGQPPGHQFRVLYQGDHLAQVFNGAWTGKTMEEIAPPRLKQYAVDTSNKCVNDGCAVYTVLSTFDAAGDWVDCERLLLPFGEDGAPVRHMISSMQLISLKGDFEHRSILANFEMRSEVLLAGTIRPAEVNPCSATVVRLAGYASGNAPGRLG